MRQEKQDIDQQLRAIQGSGMGSMQSFPMSRRSDRAYSNDYDSRSNRGSSRGGRGTNRGRNSMGSGASNPRYSNRRGPDRPGDDNEEEFHRGSSYSNSNKFQGGRGSNRGSASSSSNYSQLNKGKGGDFRRGGPKEDHASSVDRGEDKRRKG